MMNISDQESVLSKLSYRDEQFLIAENGLNNSNIMEYFYQSPFYTETGGHASINEMVRRGSIAPESAARIDGEIYMLVHTAAGANNTDESIYISQKFRQVINRPLVPLFIFYVISGTIFLSPGLGKLIERHLANAVCEFDSIIDSIKSACAGEIQGMDF
jgi:hypothetical protein